LKHNERSRSPLRAICIAALFLWISTPALAQRELHWDKIEVSAHLGAEGDLRVIETQTMVFTGAWNGGERRFRIRPRQKLFFEGLYRGVSGGWQKLGEDSRLDDVDEYAWADPRTLRWRSRLSSDPPFADTALRYELRYALSAVLLKDGDGYRLNHDFAFPDRGGPIRLFVLRFSHDAAWQPTSDLRQLYTAGPLPPGQSFVLNIPFRYAGAQTPVTLDLSRSREIQIAVAVVLIFTGLAVAWFFVRERAYGRFAPVVAEQVDEAWIKERILKHPAEVVGAAWDSSIGTQEVVALIARMVSEGKLESAVAGEGKDSSMILRLKVDRSTLEGHEGTLVSWLFPDEATETSTDRVKEHYREQGFNPANEIRPELEARVRDLLPEGKTPRAFRIETVLLLLVGVGALLLAWFLEGPPATSVVLLEIGVVVLAGIGVIAGAVFRGNIQWGPAAAWLCLLPALCLAAATAVFLWSYAGTGLVELSAEALVGIVAITLSLTNASINALRSRDSREAIALRKTLAAGREFFVSQLRKDRPALRDEWYPWLLAFGLAREVDDWSARRERQQPNEKDNWVRDSNPTSSSGTAEPQWTGFGGGRSGGAGASGSWAAAAGGMAAGVSAPRASESSGGSGSDSGSSSSSSSSASSGGGGGGGW
jgi:uncharacterized membrane protein YgcG